jgi:hypothetical protein
MKLLARTTARHTAASLMLVVWLFVLASGIANACLLEAPDHGGHQSSSESSHNKRDAAANAHDSEQGSKAPCLKACDDGSQALQSSDGMDSVDPGSPLLVTVLWTEPTPVPAHHWRFDRPPSLIDPPERIIFSRWAL